MDYYIVYNNINSVKKSRNIKPFLIHVKTHALIKLDDFCGGGNADQHHHLKFQNLTNLLISFIVPCHKTILVFLRNRGLLSVDGGLRPGDIFHPDFLHGHSA